MWISVMSHRCNVALLASRHRRHCRGQHGRINFVALLLTLHAVAASATSLRHSGRGDHRGHVAVKRSCGEREVDDYVFRKTYGPLQGIKAPAAPPDCAPPQRHSLQLATLSVANSSAKRTRPFFVQLNVFKVGADWCANPCREFTWEKAAAKPRPDDSGYGLLELAIWEDEGRVALYEFDDAWYRIADNAYHGLCGGSGWACQAVVGHRESARLWEARWEKGVAEKSLSNWLSDQLVDVLGIVFSRGGEHHGMSFSGHGSRADGSLFEGSIYKEDAVSALQRATQQRRFSLLNFGGNCVEGKWNMLAEMQPFTDYIIASDLPVNGVYPKDSERQREYLKLFMNYTALSHMRTLVSQRLAPVTLGEQLLAGERKLWEFAADSIKEQSLKQSRALLEMSRFPMLQEAVELAWGGADAIVRDAAIGAAEREMCDVGAFTEALGGQALHADYVAVRVGYVSTADMFVWDKNTTGFGFNFLGWKEPPCDIAPAVGGTSGTKLCRVAPVPFDAGFGGCDTYSQGSSNHGHCKTHWVADRSAADVCPQCGACSPLE